MLGEVVRRAVIAGEAAEERAGRGRFAVPRETVGVAAEPEVEELRLRGAELARREVSGDADEELRALRALEMRVAAEVLPERFADGWAAPVWVFGRASAFCAAS